MTYEEARNLENEIAEEELAEYRSLMEAAAASEDAEFRSDREMAIAYEINRVSNAVYRYLVYVIGTVRGTRTMVDVPEYFYTLEDCDRLARTVTASHF